MALGDGIRRNVATVSAAERARLRDAIVQLHQRYYPGGRSDTPTGGVSWWFKQDEVHAHSHVHGCPAFVPWHREMVNRFEQLIREVDPQLSLHYWDWTQDPQNAPDGNGGFVNLFTTGTTGNAFMGSASGDASDPWRTAGFYDPTASPYRSGNEFDPNNNPFDPPRSLTRDVQAGGAVTAMDDQGCVGATDFPTFDSLINVSHGAGHGHIGGTLGNAHTSFRDPFVFLMHANLDRIFALWQLQDPDTRLDPALVYGSYSNTTGSGDVDSGGPQWGILSPLEPWAGAAAQNSTTGIVINVHDTRPWAAPENEQNLPENRKDSKDTSVVKPPCYDTNPTIIQVLNLGSAISFNDVPAGETTLRAAHFRFVSCFRLTFTVTSGPNAPYTVFSSMPVTALPSQDIWTDARVWFSFTGGTAGTTAASSSVTIHCNETGTDFVLTLNGNTIARPTVAVMLALDQSGSMDDPAGNTGVRRIQALREAGALFADIIQPANGVGLIRFDTVAYPVNDPTYPGLAVATIGNGGLFDPGRIAARNAIQAHATNPNGATSIGAGVQLARNTLNPVAGFADKALIVFTDGLENTAPMIADVMGDIDQRTFAIGLGNPQQVSTAALTALTNGTGGELLLTGLLSASTEDYFLLSKYFLQILAGVTNTDIVKDPSGFLPHGSVVKIPFEVNEADIEATVLMLSDVPAVDLIVETPSGNHITPANAAGLAVEYADGGTKRYYRFTLPVALGGGQQAGTWKALIKLDESEFKRLCGGDKRNDSIGRPSACQRNGARYSVSAMAWSNLNMTAKLDQDSLEPGALLTVRARLDEYGVPVDHRAQVKAEVTAPDGTTEILALAETRPGMFQASLRAGQSGVYRFHVLANGVTMRGTTFTREKLLTGAVFAGGNQPLPTGKATGNWCQLLECLLKEPSVVEWLHRAKLDAKGIGACVHRACEGKCGG
jgi:hypothetical protein